MAVITSSSFSKALRPGIRKWYGIEYDKHPLECMEIFDYNKSNMAWEEDVGATGYGLAGVKSEGGRIGYDTNMQGYVSRYTHVVYALGFIVTREMWEDGMAERIGIKRAQALAFSMRTTKETVAANIFNRAFNTSYTMGSGSDGKPMCATDHPHKTGGTWSNRLTVDADLSEAALEQALIDISGFTTDRGLRINIQARKLVIPKELVFDASRILDNPARPATADRDINAMRMQGMIPEGFAVNHYFTDVDAWFLKTNVPTGTGLNYFERRKDEFDTDSDFDTENGRYKASSRYSFGWTDARAVFGSPGT